MTLAASESWITSPLRISADQNLFEVGGILAERAYFKPLGNVTVSINFETEEDMADHATALAAFAAPEIIGGVDLLACDGALVISSVDMVTTYQYAVIASIRPGLPSGPFSAVTRTFTIVAGLPTSTPN